MFEYNPEYKNVLLYIFAFGISDIIMKRLNMNYKILYLLVVLFLYFKL